MHQLPVGVLGRRFGHMGRRIWLMCQGLDPDPVATLAKQPKSLGHGKILPPHTRDERTVLNYFAQMSEKVAARLRANHLKSQTYYIGYRNEEGWVGGKYKLVAPENDGQSLFRLCRYMFVTYWSKERVLQVQVTAVDPQTFHGQIDLFEESNERREKMNQVTDAINERYGTETMKPGRLISHQPMPNVIAPAWRPKGVRKTV